MCSNTNWACRGWKFTSLVFTGRFLPTLAQATAITWSESEFRLGYKSWGEGSSGWSVSLFSLKFLKICATDGKWAHLCWYIWLMTDNFVTPGAPTDHVFRPLPRSLWSNNNYCEHHDDTMFWLGRPLTSCVIISGWATTNLLMISQYGNLENHKNKVWVSIFSIRIEEESGLKIGQDGIHRTSDNWRFQEDIL